MPQTIEVEVSDEKLRDLAKWSGEKAVENLPSARELRLRCRVDVGLVTVQDVADLYGIAERTAHKWLSDIEPAKSGHRHLYAVEDLPEMQAK